MEWRISANLITHNEERNIASCLESLAWADEIVVMDGGSEDETVEIALRYTDQVFVHPFDDFASQRNRALDKSNGDWIFSIDADERVTADLADEILWKTRVADARCRGFWVPIVSRIFGRRFRYSGTRDERKMRLFRIEAGRWQGKVHETVAIAGQTGKLLHAIEHESTPDLDTYLHKLMRYTALEADRLQGSGHRPTWWRQWLNPYWTFAKLYFGKLGLLDGAEGLRFCALSGWCEWIAYLKFLEQLRDVPGPVHTTDRVAEPIKEEWHECESAAA